MNDFVEFVARAVLIGAGAAALMDVWALSARRAFDIEGLDYALLGRWIGHFGRGRFVHERIASSDVIRGERALGWVAHYAIGIAFAFLLLLVWGLDWARTPTIWPAMVVGLGTIVAPMVRAAAGHGRRHRGRKDAEPRRRAAPDPRSRMLVYGIGLFVSALGLSFVWASQR